jgi:hypothetical protein
VMDLRGIVLLPSNLRLEDVWKSVTLDWSKIDFLFGSLVPGNGWGVGLNREMLGLLPLPV